MSVHYFIDGYNLMYSPTWRGEGTLRHQREQLLRFIEERRPCGNQTNRVTVVFDGPANVSAPERAGFIQVVFSDGRDADAVIKGLVEDMASPRSALVVTNDKGIQRSVRGAGARVISCEDFLDGGRDKAPKKKARSAGKAEPLDVQQINEYLKKIWKVK